MKKLFFALSFIGLLTGNASAGTVTVSAASSLTNAFRELGPVFEAQNPGIKLQFNFAASDALLAQISKGAPVDVFASADQETMDKAQAQNLLVPGTRKDFAANTLVVVVPSDSSLSVRSLSDLQQSAVKKVALGKPEAVPAGRYAQAALERAKLWNAVLPKAVFAINVRQALDYVARGEVEAGFVYATDVQAQKDKVKEAFKVATDTPITYPIAVLNTGQNAVDARKFVQFIHSPVAQAALGKFGFIRLD